MQNNSAFEGYIHKKKTRDIYTLTAKAIDKELHHLLGIIGKIEQNIATKTAHSELSKLQ